MQKWIVTAGATGRPAKFYLMTLRIYAWQLALVTQMSRAKNQKFFVGPSRPLQNHI